MPVGRQLNIRSDRAYELAVDLAKMKGKSIAIAVEEALEAHREQEIEARRKRRRALLEEDWKDRNQSTFEIEDLYDPETGLPA